MVCFFVLVAEIIFWNEFQVRFNFISVDYLVYRQEVTDNIAESYPVVKILMGVLFASLLVYWFLFPYIKHALNQREAFKQRAIMTLILIVMPVFFYTLLDQRPMHSFVNTHQNELAGNGSYQFFSAFRNNELDYSLFYTTINNNEAILGLKKEVVEKNSYFVDEKAADIRRDIVGQGEEKTLNVMLVMVESLSAKYLGVFGNEKGLTPNLDKLSEQSVFFSQFYATGNRTTRGLEAVTLSIPPTPGRSIVKRIGKESNMWSLGNVFKLKGYDVRFVYGGRGYFDNMNAFFSGNGYTIVDQSNVPEKEISFKNAWGMADEDLYTQAIKSADEAFNHQKPFMLQLLTTSNHRPFTYPNNRIDIPSGSSRAGAIKYTDWAIGDFISRAKKKPWFDDTVFIFVADHTAGGAGKTALPVSRYHIPFFIYSPSNFKAQRVTKLSSQIDLAPTIFGMLNFSYESVAFGKNILEMKPFEERALIGNYQHLGYYTPGVLSVISPRKKLTKQFNPEDGSLDIVTVKDDDTHMRRALYYYQGADYIYQNNLNYWIRFRFRFWKPW